MVTVSKSLITNRLNGDEFKRSSVLNEGSSIEQINKKSERELRRYKAKRMGAQRKY